MTSIDSLEVSPSTTVAPRVQPGKKFILERRRCATPTHHHTYENSQNSSFESSSVLINTPRLALFGAAGQTRSSSCNLLRKRFLESSTTGTKQTYIVKSSQDFRLDERADRFSVKNTDWETCSVLANPTTDRFKAFQKNQPLKVSRPEFWRAKRVTLNQSPRFDIPGRVSEHMATDFQSNKFTRSSEYGSPPASSKFIQTQVSQSQALKELLNKDLTQSVVVPIRCLLRPRLRTTGPLGQNLFSESTRTTSILVKRDQSSRDISRLNDSCSPKKKVAFAKNKMVLLFTKDS
jgi:hypothetical protein